MRHAARATGGVGHDARVLFRQRNQLLDVFDRQRHRHHQNIRRAGDLRHRRKVLGHVVFDGAHQRIGGYRTEVAEQEGVTIRGLFGRVLHADRAGRTGARLDQHLLAPVFRQLDADDARHRVRAAAGRVGDDKAHRFGGIRLGLSYATRQCSYDNKGRNNAVFNAVHAISSRTVSWF